MLAGKNGKKNHLFLLKEKRLIYTSLEKKMLGFSLHILMLEKEKSLIFMGKLKGN